MIPPSNQRRRLYRYDDLVAMGIVNNRVTLARWRNTQGFPHPAQLGPNSVAWLADEVDAWVNARTAARSTSQQPAA